MAARCYGAPVPSNNDAVTRLINHASETVSVIRQAACGNVMSLTKYKDDVHHAHCFHVPRESCSNSTNSTALDLLEGDLLWMEAYQNYTNLVVSLCFTNKDSAMVREESKVCAWTSNIHDELKKLASDITKILQENGITPTNSTYYEGSGDDDAPDTCWDTSFGRQYWINAGLIASMNTMDADLKNLLDDSK